MIDLAESEKLSDETAETLRYYQKNASSFAASTSDVDFSETQRRFLNFLPPGSLILDFGCGSGRDSKRFCDLGFSVDAVDGSPEMCDIAAAYTGFPVRCLLFQDLDEIEKYDGVWACASILHLNRKDFADVFLKTARALKEGGVMYTSFKHGTFEGIRNGRQFTDMTEDSLKDFTEKTDVFRIRELWVSSDVRPGREEEKWVNVILEKK